MDLKRHTGGDNRGLDNDGEAVEGGGLLLELGLGLRVTPRELARACEGREEGVYTGGVSV